MGYNDIPEDVAKMLGIDDMVTAAKSGTCPFCNKPTYRITFRDKQSEREADISGLCQPCQDDFFK